MARAEPPPGMELMLATDASGRSLELVADTGIFAPGTVLAMADHLGTFLKAFDRATGRIAAIPLVPPGEAQAIDAANATTTFFDTASCVHEAIAAQVARTPQHEAVSWQGRSLGYLELDAQATALAGRLVQSGVEPGDIVGVCLERTPELVVALLADLEGGRRLPAARPGLPARPHRLHDRGLGRRRAWLTTSRDRRLPGASTRARPSCSMTRGRAAAPAAPKLPQARPDSAAYVIYTSGSTGQPKGVDGRRTAT